MKKLLTMSTMLLALTAGSAQAHFQMLYTPESALNQGATIPLKAVFNHPFADEHTMEMATPEAFYVIHKGKKTDLLETLKPITWTGNTNSQQLLKRIIAHVAWAITYLS